MHSLVASNRMEGWKVFRTPASISAAKHRNHLQPHITVAFYWASSVPRISVQWNVESPCAGTRRMDDAATPCGSNRKPRRCLQHLYLVARHRRVSLACGSIRKWGGCGFNSYSTRVVAVSLWLLRIPSREKLSNVNSWRIHKGRCNIFLELIVLYFLHIARNLHLSLYLYHSQNSIACRTSIHTD